jgi:hypothetical protein
LYNCSILHFINPTPPLFIDSTLEKNGEHRTTLDTAKTGSFIKMCILKNKGNMPLVTHVIASNSQNTQLSTTWLGMAVYSIKWYFEAISGSFVQNKLQRPQLHVLPCDSTNPLHGNNWPIHLTAK